MSDTSVSGTDRSQGRGGDAAPSRQSPLSAAIDIWYLWIFALVAFAIGTYFFTHRGIWTTEAERWYVIIGGGAGFLAVLYGAYKIYTRPIIE